MAEDYNPPLLLSHLRIFKEEADKIYVPALLGEAQNESTDLSGGTHQDYEFWDAAHVAGIVIDNKQDGATYTLDLSSAIPSGGAEIPVAKVKALYFGKIDDLESFKIEVKSSGAAVSDPLEELDVSRIAANKFAISDVAEGLLWVYYAHAATDGTERLSLICGSDINAVASAGSTSIFDLYCTYLYGDMGGWQYLQAYALGDNHNAQHFILPAKVDVVVKPLDASNAIPTAFETSQANKRDIDSLKERVSSLEADSVHFNNLHSFRFRSAVLVDWCGKSDGSSYDYSYDNVKRVCYYESNSAPFPRPSDSAGKTATYTFGGYRVDMSAVTETALLMEVPAIFNGMIVAAKLYFGTSKFLFEVPYPDGINAVGLNDMWSLHFSYRAASQ